MLKLPEWVSQRLPGKGASERALWLAVQQGDAKAAKNLVQLLAPAAHALAWRMLGDSADPPHRLAHAQQAQSVQQALMALAPRQRVALALWAYQDAEAAEIARIMGLQVNAVHQLLHRAKLNLRHQLGETHVPRT